MPDERFGRLQAALQTEQLDLVVCPELFMSGYDVGDALAGLAETADGAFAQRVAALARMSGTAIVYGYPERDGEDLYNAAACMDSSGRLIANHRKLVLPPGFETRYFVPGDGLTLFDLGSVRCAILICYDAEYPEAVRAAAQAGAQLVLVPTALADVWPTVAFQMMPTRAFENGVWLFYANHSGVEGETRFLGASCIVAPDGQDAARAGPAETLISADVDVAQVSAAQNRLPYLPGARFLRDIFHLPD